MTPLLIRRQGLKKLGVKEMTYRMIFVACAVQHTDNAGGEAMLTQISPAAADQDPSVHAPVELTGVSFFI
jgi:hypothetical protein